MVEVHTIVTHWEHDNEVTKLSVEIFPLPNDPEIHQAISKAIIELLSTAFDAEVIPLH